MTADAAAGCRRTSSTTIRIDLADSAALAAMADDLARASTPSTCSSTARASSARGSFLDVGDAEWHEVLSVNLDAPRILSRAFGARHARARPRQDHQHREPAVVPGRPRRRRLHREQARARRASPARSRTSGRPAACRSTRSHPATSPPTTPRRCAATPSATPRSSRASRPAAGAGPDDLVGAAVFLASAGLRLHHRTHARRRRRMDVAMTQTTHLHHPIPNRSTAP